MGNPKQSTKKMRVLQHSAVGGKSKNKNKDESAIVSEIMKKNTKGRQHLPATNPLLLHRNRIIQHFDTPTSELNPQQRYELIAELSESILEDPRGAFTSNVNNTNNSTNNDDTSNENYLQSHSKMRRLLDLAYPSKNDQDETTTKLALLSLLAIFQDIIPSYRIRLPSAAEMSVRVSKDTKALWDYERSLLTSYQQYLKLLEHLWDDNHDKKQNKKNSSTNISVSPISVTAILCLCELLKSAPHFNFRSNILSIVIKQMNHRSCDEISTSCCNAISFIFETDTQGEIALEATKMITKLVKERYDRGLDHHDNTRIRPALLRTFLSLPLRVHEDEAQAAKIALAAKKKKRKKSGDDEDEDIEKDLKEGDATVDKIVLAQSQADTLHSITLTYFRIIKGVDSVLSDEKTKNIDKDISINTASKKLQTATALLAPALEGLAKFSHLINFDTVVDVLAVLKGLLKNVDVLPLEASLNCILACFQTLQGPGRELQIDQKEYIAPLYCQLPRLITEGCDSKQTDLALKCLHTAFIKRKEYSTVRIAAFIKQLCTVSLHAPAHISAPLLAFVRQLLRRYPNVSELLENEHDVVKSGSYTADVEDPEHSNPFATSAWELVNLRFNLDPNVSTHAHGAANNVMLQLPVEDPLRIREAMVRNYNESYIMYRATKKKHPLAEGKNQKQNRRNNVRFITPRQTLNYHLK